MALRVLGFFALLLTLTVFLPLSLQAKKCERVIGHLSSRQFEQQENILSELRFQSRATASESDFVYILEGYNGQGFRKRERIAFIVGGIAFVMKRDRRAEKDTKPEEGDKDYVWKVRPISLKDLKFPNARVRLYRFPISEIGMKSLQDFVSSYTSLDRILRNDIPMPLELRTSMFMDFNQEELVDWYEEKFNPTGLVKKNTAYYDVYVHPFDMARGASEAYEELSFFATMIGGMGLGAGAVFVAHQFHPSSGVYLAALLGGLNLGARIGFVSSRRVARFWGRKVYEAAEASYEPELQALQNALKAEPITR